MSFSFRIRFLVPASTGFNTQEIATRLPAPPGSRREALLRGVPPDRPLADVVDFTVESEGWNSEVEAERAGNAYRDSLARALARCHMGADFGLRSETQHVGIQVRGGFASLGPRAEGRDDRLGLVIFREGVSPVVSGIPTAGVSTRCGIDIFRRNLEATLALGCDMRPREWHAFELYGASFFNPSQDAALVLLVSAIEVLCRPVQLDELTVRHVDDLISATREHPDLSSRLKDSLVGRLRGLRQESIRDSLRAVVAGLAGGTYGGESADRFILKAYGLRCQLVHGSDEPPESEEVFRNRAVLAAMVADLIASPISQGLGGTKRQEHHG